MPQRAPQRASASFTHVTERSRRTRSVLSYSGPASSRRRFSGATTWATRTSVGISAESNVAAQEDDIALSSPVGDIVTEMDRLDVTASSTICAGISIAERTSFVASVRYPQPIHADTDNILTRAEPLDEGLNRWHRTSWHLREPYPQAAPPGGSRGVRIT